jgi:hypothetical protein
VTGRSTLSPGILRAARVIDALDELYELHARTTGMTSGDTPVQAAFADLSDAICTVLGQIAGTDSASAGRLLSRMLPVVERRGADGLESVLLTAFLSAMRQGVTAEAGAAAQLWSKTELFPDRLAGGARRVPVLDPARLSIGSVSMPELALAVAHSGGSANVLAGRLRDLVGGGGDGDEDFDDPTLEPIAVACADAYAATVTADGLRRAGDLSPDLMQKLGDIVGADPRKWQGPSKQLQSGLVLALGVWTAGAGTVDDPRPVGSSPAGLAPRGRRSLSTISSAGIDGPPTQPVPAQVTTQRPTWVSVDGRTAQLHPPAGLVPTPAGDDATRRGRGDVTFGTGSRRIPALEQAGLPVGTTIVHWAGGHLVDAVTGLPVPGSGPALAEAVLVEVGKADAVDVRTATVGEVVDVLLNPG